MRSRTELVTTTFIDSECSQEQSESDDSEEDWKPDSSRSGKKRPLKTKRRNKRKATSGPKSLAKKKMFENYNNPEDSDDGDYHILYASSQHKHLMSDQKTIVQSTEEKSAQEISGLYNLYLYKKDLDKDFKNNSHLCLWRRDESSLLQKYIRVKTSNCEEFIFTSSSVYSSWDERRCKDFTSITVKCMEDNNRRVMIQNPSILQVLADEMIQRRLEKTDENVKADDNDSSNEIPDSQDDDDYDDDCEEEMSEEEDMNSAKTSDDEEDDYYEGDPDEGSTTDGTLHPYRA